MGFGAEDEGVAGTVGDGVVAAVGGGGEEVQAVGGRKGEVGEGGSPVGVDADVDGIPVKSCEPPQCASTSFRVEKS